MLRYPLSHQDIFRKDHKIAQQLNVSPIGRSLALLIAISLSVPNSALALRARSGGLEEETPAVKQLGDALSQPSRPISPVGLEEDYRIRWIDAKFIWASVKVRAHDGDLFFLAPVNGQGCLVKVEHEGVAILTAPLLPDEEMPPSGLSLEEMEWFSNRVHRGEEISLGVEGVCVKRLVDGVEFTPPRNQNENNVMQVAPVVPLSRTGLEELSPRAKILDQKIREFAAKPNWLHDLQIDLDDPSVRFAIHLGKSVSGSSSPPALTQLYNHAVDLQGIRLVSIPLDTPPEALEETLEQIRQHPRVLLVTATEPHKVDVAKIVQRWESSSEWDQRVFPMSTTNNVLLMRKDGILQKTMLTNSDGPAFVEQFKKVWGRTGAQEGTFQGRKVVILGGWGGLGQALTLSILKEKPSQLVITEKLHLDQARADLQAMAEKLELPVPVILSVDDGRLSDALRKADIIINSTGVGANDNQSPIQDPAVFKRSDGQRLIVIDSIYRDAKGQPRLVTPFLRQAWDQGIQEVHNGWGLFVRDFSWEGGWLARELTGQNLDPDALETIYHSMDQWARDVRGAKDAAEVLRAAGLEEKEVTLEKPIVIPSVVETNKILILGPEVLGIIHALAHVAAEDGKPIPLVLVVKDAEQKAWAEQLAAKLARDMDSSRSVISVIDASLPPYRELGTMDQVLKSIARYYEGERGYSVFVAKNRSDMAELAPFLGVPEPESFVRMTEAALQETVDSSS